MKLNKTQLSNLWRGISIAAGLTNVDKEEASKQAKRVYYDFQTLLDAIDIESGTEETQTLLDLASNAGPMLSIFNMDGHAIELYIKVLSFLEIKLPTLEILIARRAFNQFSILNLNIGKMEPDELHNYSKLLKLMSQISLKLEMKNTHIDSLALLLKVLSVLSQWNEKELQDSYKETHLKLTMAYVDYIKNAPFDRFAQEYTDSLLVHLRGYERATEYAEFYHVAKMSKSSFFQKQGNIQEAEQVCMQELVRVFSLPQDNKLPSLKVSALQSIAQISIDKKDFANASGYYLQIIDLASDPSLNEEQAIAFLMLGMCELSKSDNKKAIEHFNTCFGLLENIITQDVIALKIRTYLSFILNVYFVEGHFKKVIELAEKYRGLVDKSDLPFFNFLIGKTYRSMKQYQVALDYCLQIRDEEMGRLAVHDQMSILEVKVSLHLILANPEDPTKDFGDKERNILQAVLCIQKMEHLGKHPQDLILIKLCSISIKMQLNKIKDNHQEARTLACKLLLETPEFLGENCDPIIIDSRTKALEVLFATNSNPPIFKQSLLLLLGDIINQTNRGIFYAKNMYAIALTGVALYEISPESDYADFLEVHRWLYPQLTNLLEKEIKSDVIRMVITIEAIFAARFFYILKDYNRVSYYLDIATTEANYLSGKEQTLPFGDIDFSLLFLMLKSMKFELLYVCAKYTEVKERWPELSEAYAAIQLSKHGNAVQLRVKKFQLRTHIYISDTYSKTNDNLNAITYFEKAYQNLEALTATGYKEKHHTIIFSRLLKLYDKAKRHASALNALFTNPKADPKEILSTSISLFNDGIDHLQLELFIDWLPKIEEMLRKNEPSWTYELWQQIWTKIHKLTLLSEDIPVPFREQIMQLNKSVARKQLLYIREGKVKTPALLVQQCVRYIDNVEHQKQIAILAIKRSTEKDKDKTSGYASILKILSAVGFYNEVDESPSEVNKRPASILIQKVEKEMLHSHVDELTNTVIEQEQEIKDMRVEMQVLREEMNDCMAAVTKFFGAKKTPTQTEDKTNDKVENLENMQCV